MGDLHDIRGAHLAVAIVGIFIFAVWFIGWPILFFIARGRADRTEKGWIVFTALGWTSWSLILVGWVLAIINMALIIHASLCLFGGLTGYTVTSNCPQSASFYSNLIVELSWTGYISPILIVVGVAILIAHAVTANQWMEGGGGEKK